MSSHQHNSPRGLWIDQRISLGLLIALLMQAGSIVWWAAAKEQQDHFQDTRLAHSEQLLSQMSNVENTINERLARLEARSESQLEILQQIQKHRERE